MATDVSIVAKMDSSQIVSSVKQAADATRQLDAEVKQTQRSIDLLQTESKKMDMWRQWDEARKALAQYKKEISSGKVLWDDTAKASLTQQAAAVDKLKASWQSLSKETAKAAKEEVNMRDQMSKTDNDMMSRAGGGSGGGLGGGIGATLVRMRLYAQLGQAAQDYMFALGKSMYGERTGSAISNILGGATSGFTMGLYTGNPYVMAAGAVIGAGTGVIKTTTERLEKKDDAFRAEVERLYDTVTQDRELGLQAGIEYAATEESNLKALGILLGSAEKGEALYQELKNYGVNTMYQTPNMLTSAKRMLAYGVDENQIVQAVKWIGDVAMGDQSKFDSLAYVYGQTASAGKLTGQDLRQYTEAGFNPLAWLAEERGVSLEAMREEMSAGKVLYQDVMHAFELATAEGAKFGGSAEAMMNTYAGKLSKLADLQDIANSGYGVGYNREREKGLDYEIEQYEGKFGDSLKKANELIGAYEADLENQHQQMLIDSQEALLSDKDFIELSKVDAVKAGELLAQAKADAEIQWNNSEGMLQKQQAEIALVEGIAQDAAINGAYIELGIQRADAFTLGWNGAMKKAFQNGEIPQEVWEEQQIKNGNVLPSAAEITGFSSWGKLLRKIFVGDTPQTTPTPVATIFNTPQEPIFNREAFKAQNNITETQNNHQTFNVSTSITVNEATNGALLGNIALRQISAGLTSATNKAAKASTKSTGWAQRLGGR